MVGWEWDYRVMGAMQQSRDCASGLLKCADSGLGCRRAVASGGLGGNPTVFVDEALGQ